MDKPPRLHIYYDGECPMCTVFADTIGKHDPEQTLIDVTTAKNLPADKNKLLHEIHFYEADGLVRTGADAVLTSLARIYRWLQPLVFLVRLPGFSWLADRCYFFISKRRKLWFGSETARLYWLFLLTTLGLLLGIILSWPLWQSVRDYPIVPLIKSAPALAPITPLLSISLIGVLSIGLFLTKNFHLLARTSLGLLIILVLLDNTRLQPWILHYGLLFTILSFWYHSTDLKVERLLDAARFIVVGIYFWSGLQKLNTAFYLETFPWFTEPLWKPFGDTGATLMLCIGIFVPFIEFLLALGLLTKRFRNLSIIGSSLMLILVTASLMIGRDWNIVVWPWNFALFSMVIVLFYRLETPFVTIMKRTKQNILALGAISLCLLLPIGNIFGYVDHYLSWSLYSGHVPTATITAAPETLTYLNPTLNFDNLDIDMISHTMRFATWSFATVGVPPYPEEHIFKAIFTQVCTDYPFDTELRLTIETRDFFLSHHKTETSYSCASLQKELAEK